MITVLADANLPSDVKAQINSLGGMYLWLLNSLAVACLAGAGGLIWMEKGLGMDVKASPWVVKIILSVMVAAAASDIAAVVIQG
ncbi:hypothetical protein FOS14_19470 [Skermania sp. ID1734]|uniref:hypothetical protein n=1 Tax=Skermania sp. ID1734 TaxID=2597516 RepID=UPI00117EB478|nr:hypothetical protein [Skermania sp. ID1734]TSD94824.1 hypothetical protein FOS14_19470 [Skermania sp. ID1734]